MTEPQAPIVNGVRVHSHVGEWCPLCLEEGYRRVIPIRRALAATPDAPLDVERLAEAVFRVGISRWKDGRSEPLPWAVEHQQEWARWLGQAQDAIAREYAATLDHKEPEPA